MHPASFLRDFFISSRLSRHYLIDVVLLKCRNKLLWDILNFPWPVSSCIICWCLFCGLTQFLLIRRGKTASISTEECRNPIETFRYFGYSAFSEASPILSSCDFRPALTIRFKNAGRGRSADDDRAPEVTDYEITGRRVWVWEDCPAAWHIGEHGEVVLPQAEPQ